MSKLHSANDLLKMDVCEIKEWLNAVQSGNEITPDGFNWLGLAEAAAFNAHVKQDSQTPASRLEWASIAVSVYERLAKDSSFDGEDSRESFELSAMHLRAYLIRELGTKPNHAILDANSIVQWFLDSLKLSVEQVHKHCIVYQALGTEKNSIEMLRGLRQIKNRLSVIKSLVNSGQIKPNRELTNWLSLFDKLP
jgi:hypothetical protein